MATGIFRKLLAATTKPDPLVEAAQADLSHLEKGRPVLSNAVAALRDLLPLLYERGVREQPPSITLDRAASKLQSGIPLLRGESIALDTPFFQRRWTVICKALQRYQNDATAQRLAQALRAGQLHPPDMFAQVIGGRPEHVYEQTEILGIDTGLSAMVLRLSLFPVLSHLQQALKSLTSNISWPRGYCFCCGSWPLLGEFRGLEQTRFLRCGLCSAEWEFPRLRCAFCDCSDHEVLSFFHVEGEEGNHRAATCDACRGYVKMISTLQALSGPQLLVADLATMHLDLALCERGYGVVTPSLH